MSKTTQAKKAAKAAEKELLKVEESAEGQTTVETRETPTVEVTSSTVQPAPAKKVSRGKAYLSAKKKVDRNKFYDLKDGVELAVATNFSKFKGKLEAHLLLLGEAGTIGEIVFPHMDVAAKKIVVASDSVIADLKNGKVDFDILVATPATMPKLLPFARLLGPKGLMPNPKNGTLTEDTEAAIKKLSVAKTVLKTEKSAPVVHVVVGRLTQPTEELVKNVEELIRVANPTKIKKLVLSATMGPGVKIAINK